MTATSKAHVRLSLKKALRYTERFFLVVGLAALGVYAAVEAYSTAASAYDNWIFNQALKNSQPVGDLSGTGASTPGPTLA